MLFSLIFVPLGLVILAAGWFLHQHATKRALVSENWPMVQGHVISSGVVVDENNQHKAKVVYRYRVGEEEHIGKRIYFGDNLRFEGDDEARAIIARYPEGSDVAVRYDPQKPKDAVLETMKPRINKWLMIFGGVMLVLGPLIDLFG